MANNKKGVSANVKKNTAPAKKKLRVDGVGKGRVVVAGAKLAGGKPRPTKRPRNNSTPASEAGSDSEAVADADAHAGAAADDDIHPDDTSREEDVSASEEGVDDDEEGVDDDEEGVDDDEEGLDDDEEGVDDDEEGDDDDDDEHAVDKHGRPKSSKHPIAINAKIAKDSGGFTRGNGVSRPKPELFNEILHGIAASNDNVTICDFTSGDSVTNGTWAFPQLHQQNVIVVPVEVAGGHMVVYETRLVQKLVVIHRHVNNRDFVNEACVIGVALKNLAANIVKAEVDCKLLLSYKITEKLLSSNHTYVCALSDAKFLAAGITPGPNDTIPLRGGLKTEVVQAEQGQLDVLGAVTLPIRPDPKAKGDEPDIQALDDLGGFRYRLIGAQWKMTTQDMLAKNMIREQPEDHVGDGAIDTTQFEKGRKLYCMACKCSKDHKSGATNWSQHIGSGPHKRMLERKRTPATNQPTIHQLVDRKSETQRQARCAVIWRFACGKLQRGDAAAAALFYCNSALTSQGMPAVYAPEFNRCEALIERELWLLMLNDVCTSDFLGFMFDGSTYKGLSYLAMMFITSTGYWSLPAAIVKGGRTIDTEVLKHILTCTMGYVADYAESIGCSRTLPDACFIDACSVNTAALGRIADERAAGSAASLAKEKNGDADEDGDGGEVECEEDDVNSADGDDESPGAAMLEFDAQDIPAADPAGVDAVAADAAGVDAVAADAAGVDAVAADAAGVDDGTQSTPKTAEYLINALRKRGLDIRVIRCLFHMVHCGCKDAFKLYGFERLWAFVFQWSGFLHGKGCEGRRTRWKETLDRLSEGDEKKQTDLQELKKEVETLLAEITAEEYPGDTSHPFVTMLEDKARSLLPGWIAEDDPDPSGRLQRVISGLVALEPAEQTDFVEPRTAASATGTRFMSRFHAAKDLLDFWSYVHDFVRDQAKSLRATEKKRGVEKMLETLDDPEKKDDILADIKKALYAFDSIVEVMEKLGSDLIGPDEVYYALEGAFGTVSKKSNEIGECFQKRWKPLKAFWLLVGNLKPSRAKRYAGSYLKMRALFTDADVAEPTDLEEVWGTLTAKDFTGVDKSTNTVSFWSAQLQQSDTRRVILGLMRHRATTCKVEGLVSKVSKQVRLKEATNTSIPQIARNVFGCGNQQQLALLAARCPAPFPRDKKEVAEKLSDMSSLYSSKTPAKWRKKPNEAEDDDKEETRDTSK